MGKNPWENRWGLNVIYRNLISVEQENDGEIEKEMIYVIFDIC
jgi:hypothetical protein